MNSAIISLWEENLLPIKDGVYFSNGKSISKKIYSYPAPRIENGQEFDLNKFLQDNTDETTSIDGLKEISLKNKGYCLVGEGSHGSEGFIAHLDKNHELIWVIYSEESNPFINIMEEQENIVTVESSANFKIKIDVNDPVNLEIIQ
jgi:hypothetical protein